MSKRTNHDAAFKARVALEALKGERTVASCRPWMVHTSTPGVYRHHDVAAFLASQAVQPAALCEAEKCAFAAVSGIKCMISGSNSDFDESDDVLL